MSIQTKLETITPKRAQLYLESNTHNRKLNEREVDKIVYQIRNGQWKINGDSITFDKNGTLVDGQHRLNAIIKAGKNVRTLVCTGVDPDSFDTIDKGRPRSFGDDLSVLDVKNQNNKASLANNLIRWSNRTFHTEGGGRNVWTVSHDVTEMYFKYQDDIDYAVGLAGGKGIKTVARGNAGMALFLLSREYSREVVDLFLQYMREGGDYTNSPTHTVPMYLLQKKSAGIKMHRKDDFYILVWAFERWLNRQACARINPPKIREKNYESYYNRYQVEGLTRV